MDFTQFIGYPNIFRKVFELNGKQEEILLGVYVDDLLICSSSEEARLWLMSRLEARFPVSQLILSLLGLYRSILQVWFYQCK